MRQFGAQGWDHAAGSAGQDVQKTNVGEDEPDGRNISPAQNQTANDGLRAADPTRPVYQNFTKGIYPGNWTTDADKRAWCASADIVSLDFYASTDPWESPNGHLGPFHYGRAVDAIHQYCPGKPALAFMETSQPFNSSNRIYPWELEAGIWNQIVHGASGIEYFVHDFYTADGGSNLWTDAVAKPVADRMTAVDQAVTSFAAQLNSPTVSGISATGQNGVPVSTLGKDDGGKLWLLAQADGDPAHALSNTTPMTATITLPSAVAPGTVLDVVGEGRTVTANAGGQIVDTFGTKTESGKTFGYQEHIYRQR
jgi:hypothetical protein